ncbi:MAG TPA: phosphopyruvate hydratase [Candidatus Paceibacterota bacterium]|nr:phosphopyruvate hydratase [Candidatus Paceibacterota bacterium]
MSKIKFLHANEIIDSRGNPTLETFCELESGVRGRCAVPSGASTGSHEALELRDRDPARYGGLGVIKAVANVNGEMNDKLKSREFDQASLDRTLIELDATGDLSRLGANAILSVSIAFARAQAAEEGAELFQHLGRLAGNTSFKLPEPAFNIINGGEHADSGLEIQEFMIVPAGIEKFSEKVRAASEIISALKKNLSAKGYSTGVGDEGGFAPKLASNEEALDLIAEAVKSAGYSADSIKIALDAAASTFFKDGGYFLKIKGTEKRLDSAELVGWYQELVNSFPIISIEDGLAEEDWQGFEFMYRQLGGKIKIVGDDLLVTNVERMKKAKEAGAVNGAIIKPNQIGTVSETLEAVKFARNSGWTAFASHRSGETDDTFIADLAVGFGCDFFKAGSLARGERVVKYNRLMEIERLLNQK